MFPGEMGLRHTVSSLGLSASAGMFFTQPETSPRSSPPATQEDATEVLPHTEQLTSFHQPNDKCSTKTAPRHTASGHNHAPVCGAEGRIGKQSSEESARLLLGVAAAAWKGSRGRPYKAESYGVRDLSCLVPAEGGSDCGCNLIYSGQPLRRIVGHLMDKMTICQRALCLWEGSRRRVTFISHPPRIKLLAVRPIDRTVAVEDSESPKPFKEASHEVSTS